MNRPEVDAATRELDELRKRLALLDDREGQQKRSEDVAADLKRIHADLRRLRESLTQRRPVETDEPGS